MPAPGGVNANLFALLDDDDDDNSPAPAQKKQAQKPAQPKAEDQPNKPKKQGKGNNNRGKGGEERDNSVYDGSDKPSKPSDTEGRKGGQRRERGEGKGSGRKGGKGEGRREYDRRSQDGRKGGKGEKREGGGKYNWGDKTEVQPAAGDGTPVEGAEAPVVEVEPEPVEEEDETMSLEEYLAAQKAKSAAALPQLPAQRKVGEAKDHGAVFQRDQGGKEDEMFGMIFADYNGKRTKGHGKEEREGWVAADNVLNMKFADKQRDDDRSSKGKGKGDRREGGKGKGDGGRGAKKASRPSGPGFSGGLDDASAFPSL